MTLGGANIRTDEDELFYMIQTLEANGYVVRKPSEAKLTTVLEVEYPHDPYEIGIRLDTVLNGVPYATTKRFPAEMVLSREQPSFREEALPRMFADMLGRYISQQMLDGIADQVKEKIEPLVPEERMGLDEIVSHIASALGTTKHRIEPRFYDEDDNRIAPGD